MVKQLIKILTVFILGLITAYITFYLRGMVDTRAHVAEVLAKFYSSAAAEFYAQYELQTARNEGPVRVPELYKIYDQDYKEFLAGSTELAAIVPKRLQNEVLGIEETWNQLSDEEDQAARDAKWFAALDKIRQDVLDSISYSRFFDLPWRANNY